MTAREEILDRLRAARSPAAVTVPRQYRRAGETDPRRLAALLTDRLVDYRAGVHPCAPEALPATIDRVLTHLPGSGLPGSGLPAFSGKVPSDAGPGPALSLKMRGGLVVPPDLPADWLDAYSGVVLRDGDPEPLAVADLDGAGAVLTGCAVAIAQTGTLVLDTGTAQGRRALTLVPDHHVCVVHLDQVVASVPEALARLADPTRPLTFVSGPSATSDIELKRVEGVHGPRRLDVILVSPRT